VRSLGPSPLLVQLCCGCWYFCILAVACGFRTWASAYCVLLQVLLLAHIGLVTFPCLLQRGSFPHSLPFYATRTASTLTASWSRWSLVTSVPVAVGYPFQRRLGGPQGRSGRTENLVANGIWSRTVQPVVSRYTYWATRPTVWYIPTSIYGTMYQSPPHGPKKISQFIVSVDCLDLSRELGDWLVAFLVLDLSTLSFIDCVQLVC